jgi:2-dehydro-3-deoxygalactonokinase
MSGNTPLIAVDWGSTNLRAKLFLDGCVAASVESPDGIRHRDGRAFEDILAAACGAWKRDHPDARVLMSGMIGSREGWREAPYATAPAGLAELAARFVSIESPVFGEISIVPGVRWDDPATGRTDVMRGEETQIAGLLPDLPASGAVVCLPGTHSKWVVCRSGRIERFRTWLTGEAFDSLTRPGSLIAGSGDGTVDVESEVFARGLECSDGEGGLLHHLFLGRTEMLTGRVDPADLRTFVSGLLIGHEIREALRFAAGLPIWLVGQSPAAGATARALRWQRLDFQHTVADVQLSGLLRLAGVA